MRVQDLKIGDLIELCHNPNLRIVLTNEFKVNDGDDSFITSEDDREYIPFRSISKVWRQNTINKNYTMIFDRFNEISTHIGDLTLAEAKEYCSHRECDACQLYDICGKEFTYTDDELSEKFDLSKDGVFNDE